MAEDEGRQHEDETEDEETEDTGEQDTAEQDDDGAAEDEDPVALRRDRDAAIKRRDKALARARKAEEELAKAKAGKDEDKQPDPVIEANTRLVRAEARTQLAAAGVTDRQDQRAVLEILSLEGIEVDDSGEVDEDEVAERIETLKRAFGGASAAGRTRRPRTDTRDKGAKGGASDPDAARYRRIIGGTR